MKKMQELIDEWANTKDVHAVKRKIILLGITLHALKLKECSKK